MQVSHGSGGMTPTRRRFLIMALLFVTVVINYLDRSNLSIAAPALTSEFGLIRCSSAWCSRRSAGPTRHCRYRAVGLSIACIRGCFTRSRSSCGQSRRSVWGSPPVFVMLIILRMTVGLFEVPSFLINNRIATTWFGERERATCIAVYTSAEFVGLAFLTPLLAWLKVTFGWPAYSSSLARSA